MKEEGNEKSVEIKPITRLPEKNKSLPGTPTVSTARLSVILSGRGKKAPFVPTKGAASSQAAGDEAQS